MGFGYPRAEREGLVASDPDTSFLPTASRSAARGRPLRWTRR